MAQQVPKVFISATSADLRSMRGLVKDALLSMGCLPVVQDHFGPDYRDVSGMLRAKIAECDALIHIVGMRYGAEPDPESIPEGKARRSYTQMEVDLARELKLEKVFTFVCPEEFPYDTTDAKGEPVVEEAAELRALQSAHRQRLLSQKELRYRAGSPEELATQVREIQLELREVKGQLAGTRAKMLRVGGGIVLALLVICGGLIWVLKGQQQHNSHVRQVSETVSEVKTDLSAVRAQFANNPGLIIEQLKEFIRDKSKGEIEGARKAGDWERLVELEEARDRQLQDVDRLVTSIQEGLAGKADPIFVTAAEILGTLDPETGGPENALRYLQASRSRLLAEVDRLIEDEEATREQKEEKLRAVLLEAELHKKAYEWEAALDDLRLVVDKAPMWWEALNRLGNLCQEQAILDEAEKNLRLALAIATDEQRPESQNNLAYLLASQGKNDEAEPLYREALATMQRVSGRDHPDTLSLINNLAVLLATQGRNGEAESLHREALESNERVLGRKHPDTLISISNLAIFLTSQGRHKEAEVLYREAMATSMEVFGREHPKTLTIINNTAESLSNQGRNEEAEPLYREALETRTRVLGREHPDTLVSINNLAGLLSRQGKADEVESLYREALKTSERVLGREHPDTLGFSNNLATFLGDQGKQKEAELILRDTLVQSERTLGHEHPQTLTTINNLAFLLASQGNNAEAEILYRDSLATSARVLGREHPKTLEFMVNLAGWLSSQGKHGDAELLYREAMESRERLLGHEHPDTQVSINNFALVLNSQGKHSEAEPLFREVLSMMDRTYGHEHPQTLAVINNLAGALSSQGKYEEAESLHRKAFESSERVLGREHPQRLGLINSLAVFLEGQGNYEEAEPFYRDAVELSERVFGREHPVTLRYINNMAGLYQSKGNYAEAEPLYREALEARDRALGRQHPDTLTSISNMAVLLNGQGKHEEAEPLFREALAGSVRNLGWENPTTQTVSANFFEFCMAKGLNAAEALSTRLEILDSVLPTDSPILAGERNSLGVTYFQNSQFSKAIEAYEQALAIYDTQDNPGTAWIVTTVNLGAALREEGQVEEGRRCMQRGLEAWSQIEEPNHSAVARAQYHLGMCEEILGNITEARAALDASLESYGQIGSPSESVAAMIRQTEEALARLKNVGSEQADR